MEQFATLESTLHQEDLKKTLNQEEVKKVVGDGEAETGPLATSWHSNKFLNPIHDGAVLPILHLNGFKIANPTVLARIDRDELEALFRDYGYHPYFVAGSYPETMQQLMAAILDVVIAEIKEIQRQARVQNVIKRLQWPMIILQTPKGWIGLKEIDGKQVEGSWRSHQVPFTDFATNPSRLKLLENWMKSYRPEELFDEQGKFKQEFSNLAPQGNRRMGANHHANGGVLLRDLRMSDFHNYAVSVTKPGIVEGESKRNLGGFLRDIMKLNMDSKNFRVMGPDETASNRLDALFEVTERAFDGKIYSSDDDYLSPNGRVMEILSEHMCQGWLEGYLLTGRHGLFSCYEAFIHIIDWMFNQHAKWLKTTRHIPWPRPIASLNYLLTSHVWRQDHNGFSHQDPGFIDHVANKKAEVIRIYLPPDADTLLSVADHCLKSRNNVNVIVAGKQPALQYLTIDEASQHCAKGIGIWKWASNDFDSEPDVIMACAGDVPAMETLAAIDLLRQHVPDLKIRFIIVIDLMVLQPKSEHPHGLSDKEFDELITTGKPIIFAFHGYPWLIHRLTYRRTNHKNLHVRGYKEEGKTNTPFDMVVLNDLDRFHLYVDKVERVPRFAKTTAYIRELAESKLLEHKKLHSTVWR